MNIAELRAFLAAEQNASTIVANFCLNVLDEPPEVWSDLVLGNALWQALDDCVTDLGLLAITDDYANRQEIIGVGERLVIVVGKGDVLKFLLTFSNGQFNQLVMFIAAQVLTLIL